MRTLSIGLAAGVGALVAALAAQAPAPSPDPAAPVPDSAVPATIPDAEHARKNPRAATPESKQNGEEVFLRQCAMCHGSHGDGKGTIVGQGTLAIPDFTAPNPLAGRTDGDLFYIITVGHGRMPGRGAKLLDNTKWDLVNFLRTLPPPAQPASSKRSTSASKD